MTVRQKPTFTARNTVSAGFFIDFQRILLRLIAVLEGNRADEHAGVL